MAFVCQECHNKDKVWLRCQFQYYYHAEWKFVPCEICGKKSNVALINCKRYDSMKKNKKEAGV